MRLKEMIRRKKEVMHPERFRLNYYILPVYFVLVLATLISIAVLGTVYGDTYMGVGLCIFAGFLLLTAAFIVYIESIAKKELKIALDEYAYLFEETKGSDTPVEAVDEEMNMKYLVKKDGLQITYPTQGEAVFAEVGENTEFLPWTDGYLELASDNFCRRVRLALVVIDTTKEMVYEGGVLPPEAFFLPMTKELYHALVGFGLVEEMGIDFYYLRHNPKDGMKKILNFGYIKRF